MSVELSTTNQAALSWIRWGIGTLFVILQVAIQISVGPMITLLQSDLHLTYSQLGLLSSIFFYSYIVMQIPSGILLDKFGCRQIFIYSTLATACACLGASYSNSFYALLFWRFCMGISCAPAICMALTIGATQFRPSMFAFMAGLTESLAMIGGLLGEEALGFATHNHISWRSSFVIFAILHFLVFILGYMLLAKRTVANGQSKPFHSLNIFEQLLPHLKNKQIILNGLYSACTFAVVIVFAGLLGIPFLKIQYQLSEAQAVNGCSLLFLGLAIGMPVIGKLDQQQINRKKLMISCGLMAAILFLAIIFPIIILSPLQLYIGLFFIGFWLSSYVLPFVIVKEQVPAEQKSSVIGFVNMMCFVIGALIVQPFSSVILQYYGDQQPWPYQLALLPLIISLFIAMIIPFFFNSRTERSH